MSPRRFVSKRVLLEAAIVAGKSGVERRECAELLGVGNNQHLARLLDEMVQEQLLVKAWDERPYPPRWRFFAVQFKPGVDRLTFDDQSLTSSLSLLNNDQQYNYLYALAGYDVAVGVAS